MTFEKPTKLINLLISLRDEPVKTNYEDIHIKIVTETMTTEFEYNSEQLNGLVYKKLIQQSVKDFIYSRQTQDALENLNWVIDFLDDASILTR